MKTLVAALLLLAPRAEASAPAARIERILRPQSGKTMEVVAEQAIVKFSSSTSLADRDTLLQGAGASRSEEIASVGWTVVQLPVGSHVADGIDALRRLPGVENVQPNHVYHPLILPNDPLVGSQSNLSQIDAPGAWDFETGSSHKVTIAVVDTGIQGNHPDLVGKLDTVTGLSSKDCTCLPCVNNSPPTPSNGADSNHATLVAGVAAASAGNGAGIAGVSWGAQLLSLKVFDGNCGIGGDDASVARAISYAITQQATPAAGQVVINMSLGAAGLGACPGICPGVDCFSVSQAAIANAVAANVPVIVAAGNESGPVDIPANCPGALPVGSVGPVNQVSSFSNQGPELAANGVVAPGESILSTDVGGTYGSESGTSFSSPHVAGLAALILSAKPGLTPAQVQTVIRGGADNTGAAPAAQGAGRINAFRSLRLAEKGTLATYEGDQKAIAFPNPFRPAQSGSVSFSIPPSVQGAKTSIKIFTVSGEYVQTLAGLTWDGRNAGGNLVASGTYIFVVSTANGTSRGRLAVIR